MTPRTVGYLSGAPRVSTRDDSESVGPRAHVVGMIRGFEKLGFRVTQFILGDRWLKGASGNGSEQALSRSALTRALADILRLMLRVVTPRLAIRALGVELAFVYERFGAFQAMGRVFQRRGVPWVLETNALYFVEALTDRRAILFWRVERWLELRAYKRCDVLVAISEALADQVRDHGVRREILVVPNGVDPDRFLVSEQPASADPMPRVLFVGSAIEAQGVDVLLRALGILRREGVEVRCVVVGDGPKLDAWRMLAEELGIDDAVDFRGRVPWSEVPRVASQCHVGFVGPRPTSTSSMYHSSLKLYEYLASGLSVVARQEPSVARLLTGGAGHLFEPEDPASCAEAIKQAIADRRGDPSLANRIRALARHESWESRAAVVADAVTRVGEIPESA